MAKNTDKKRVFITKFDITPFVKFLLWFILMFVAVGIAFDIF